MAGMMYTCRSPLAKGQPAGIPWMGLTAVPKAPAHLTRLVPVYWCAARAMSRPSFPCFDPSASRVSMGMLS
eukprot:15729118-Heterocapsa_arctica.AAC.1